MLSIFSGGALAGDAATPAPHWSGLPIWGVEAEARGYQIPLPFGIGVTAYSAEQPVNIQDLQLGRNGKPPVSVKNFLLIDKVDTSQQNVSAKLDVLVFPFLDVYALLGYTKGTTKGLIQVPGDPIVGIIEPRVLQLNAVVQRPDLRRRLDAPGRRQGQRLAGPDGFRGGRLEPHPDQAVVRKRNVDRPHEADGYGLLGQSGLARHRRPLQWARRSGSVRCISGSSKTVAGSVADTDLQFIVVQSPTKPWNTLLGGLFEFGKDGYVLARGRARRAQVDPRGSGVPVLIASMKGDPPAIAESRRAPWQFLSNVGHSSFYRA